MVPCLKGPAVFHFTSFGCVGVAYHEGRNISSKENYGSLLLFNSFCSIVLIKVIARISDCESIMLKIGPTEQEPGVIRKSHRLWTRQYTEYSKMYHYGKYSIVKLIFTIHLYLCIQICLTNLEVFFTTCLFVFVAPKNLLVMSSCSERSAITELMARTMKIKRM